MAPGPARRPNYRPKIRELFGPDLRRTTLWVTLVCSVSLTAHWAFLFWHQQQLRNLPEVLAWSPEEKNKLATLAMYSSSAPPSSAISLPRGLPAILATA